MPGLDLYRRWGRSDMVRGPAVACREDLVEDDSPTNSPYTGAWVIAIADQPFPLVFDYTWMVDTKQIWWEPEDPIHEPENTWYVKEVFTQEDLVDREEIKARELIFLHRIRKPVPYFERIASRLLSLFTDAKEEEPDSVGISAGSLRSFLNFLQSNARLKCPSLSLTPDHNLYASWRGEQNQVFSVHFLPHKDVRFVLFQRNDRHPEKTVRISGATTSDILMETVSSYGVWDWMSE